MQVLVFGSGRSLSQSVGRPTDTPSVLSNSSGASIQLGCGSSRRFRHVDKISPLCFGHGRLRPPLK
jgi:hypothetical protein